MYKKSLLMLLVCLMGVIAACKKNGTGGENAIAAFPKHHGVSIPNATVYIKYGATELPGLSASDYDDSKVAVREGSAAPHVHFEGLLKGDYYIYAVGYDSTINEPVRGGLSVKITSKSGEKDVDIPVTE
jgi:hypothetical protein